MKSLVKKRSVVIVGHKTSVSLEDAFWKALKEIAIRLFVLDFYRHRIAVEQAAPPQQRGHSRRAHRGR
jgi:hypothetical protein